MRLRGRLLCLIAAALLPAVALQIDFEHEARKAREAAQREEALRIVRLLSADLANVVGATREFLSALVNLDPVVAGDAETCNRTLRALLHADSQYAGLSLVDRTGRITCSAEPSAIGRDVSGSSYFQRAQAEGRFVVGDYAVGASTGRPSLHLALPLGQPRDGRDGVLSAALDLGWLARRLADLALPPGGSAIILDRNGTVLSRWPDPDQFIGRIAPPQVLATAFGPDYRVGTGRRMDGVHSIYAVAPIGLRPDGLAVGVSLDLAPAEAAIAAANLRGLLLITVSGLCALLLASFAARRFLEQPVEALVTVMERWRTGDRTARALADPRLRRLGPKTEFGRIAEAFDLATAAVEARGAALRESEARLRQIAAALDDALVIVEPRQRRVVYASPAFARLFGLRGDPQHLRAEAFLHAVHPEDRPRVVELIGQSPELPFDTEYRIQRPDGLERRVRHRRFPVPDSPTGRVVGLIADVTEEREAAERQILLAREVDHRAKNILSVVQSILRLSRADSPRAYAQAVEGRVAALARAHQLLARSRWAGADLIEVLREEFAPYTDGAREGSRAARRVLLQGPPMRLRPEAVQPLAMVVHELATNSAKHGALSVPGGTLRVTWAPEAPRPGGQSWFRLRWEETGGPRIEAMPETSGFGSRVVAATVERQLGGEVRYEWNPAGLVCRIAFTVDRLMPAAAPDALGRTAGESGTPADGGTLRSEPAGAESLVEASQAVG